MSLQTAERTPTVLSTPAGGNALIAVAHPDDEFLIGGVLGLFKKYGITTHAVIATDGEASDRGDPERLRNRERRLEAGKALFKYGIRRENQHFLGVPDGQVSLEEHTATVTHAIGLLLDTHPISTVVTLGRGGYDNHRDHQAVHQAAEQADAIYGSDGLVYGLTKNEGHVQIPFDPALKLKRLAPHESQFEIYTEDESYKPIPGTIEQPGIRISEQSRAYLQPYYSHLRLQMERYERYRV